MLGGTDDSLSREILLQELPFVRRLRTKEDIGPWCIFCFGGSGSMYAVQRCRVP
jgi:hypothetical protein